MTRDEAEKLARTLFAYYPNTRTDEWNLNAYAAAFVDMDVRVVRAAITRVTRTNKFLPTVAEIASACLANARGERRTGEEAYVEVMLAVRRYGRSYGTGKLPPFRDPIIAECIGVWGSWNDVCNSPENDAAGRARFIEAYDRKASKQDTHAVLPSGLRKEREFGFVSSGVVNRLPEARTNKPPTPAEIDAFDRESMVKQ